MSPLHYRFVVSFAHAKQYIKAWTMFPEKRMSQSEELWTRKIHTGANYALRFLILKLNKASAKIGRMMLDLLLTYISSAKSRHGRSVEDQESE